MPPTTRKPTGLPAWPILLIAGVEKSGKSYASAAASASEHVGRTFWIPVGEDGPDELGALPGARFEIVVHDGTYRQILQSLQWAAAQPAEDGKPNLIVLDSATRMWALLSDMAQADANRRRKSDEAPISMDLWNVAKSRWQHLLDVFRQHQGPSILTARLDVVTVMDGDKPTKDKDYKVQAEKGLPFEVGAAVHLHALGDAFLTGVRSLKFKPTPGEVTPFNPFTVEDLWQKMGLLEKDGAGTRSHSRADGDQSVRAEDALIAERSALLAAIRQSFPADQANARVSEVAQQWHQDHGHQIQATEDMDGLRALLDALRQEAQA